MTGADDDSKAGFAPNPGYAAFQLAKSLTTSETHADPAARARAAEKVAAWERVLRNILTGSIEYGSRAPLSGVPVWATPEVVTGGFATGQLLAAGGEECRAQNAWYLSEQGLSELRERLHSGRYEINLPEEGALLVVAWLVEQNRPEQARAVLDSISPWLATLRFYPIPLAQPRHFGMRVHLRNVQEALTDIRAIRPNLRILAQKEAVEIWAPFYDRMIALFLESVEEGVPCRRCPDEWRERAGSLVREYYELRGQHQLCGKPDQVRGYFAQLRLLLSLCAERPRSLTPRQTDQLRKMLEESVRKRGLPDSAQCRARRLFQQRSSAGPTFHAIATVVASRMADQPGSDGLDAIDHLTAAVNEQESAVFRVPTGTSIPESICRKVARCLNDTIAALVEKGLITSGEALARVLPQMTSGLRAWGIPDPALRQLYGAIYRAFRRRRSLLLTNLQKQVQIEELPWMAAIDSWRASDFTSREQSAQALRELVMVTLRAFPHAILPNKLLQELGTLAKTAQVEIPLVEEVAADIFVGQFSTKFVEAARVAAQLLGGGTLYERYYGIDFDRVRSLAPNALAKLCSERAGVRLATGTPALNGMIIEQQQILTTQNLAGLLVALDLAADLQEHLPGMAQDCFEWICRRLQVKTDNWHAQLVTVKNCAYAWRQMIFFLSLLPSAARAESAQWMETHFAVQAEGFRQRFRPALEGLLVPDAAAPRFLGWTRHRHWLLPPDPRAPAAV